MNLWRLLDEIAAVAPLQGPSRLLPGSLFNHMQFLIDDGNERYSGEFGEAMNTRMRDLAITRSLEQDESHAVPIDINAVLSECKREVYRPKALARGGKAKADEQTECPVCLEQFEANDELLRLPCNHIFHPDCLVPWIRHNHDRCPFCRAEILPRAHTGDTVAGPSNITVATPTHHHHHVDPFPTNVPPHSHDTHATRNVPIHLGRPTLAHSLQNSPTTTNYGTPAIRNVPIHLGRPTLSNNLQNSPTNYGRPAIDVPIFHARQPHYRRHHDAPSRGGYTRRDNNGILIAFAEMEATWNRLGFPG